VRREIISSPHPTVSWEERKPSFSLSRRERVEVRV
jgi:hypothetical protein